MHGCHLQNCSCNSFVSMYCRCMRVAHNVKLHASADKCLCLTILILAPSEALKSILTWCVVDPCIIVKFIQKNPTRCNSISKFIIPYLYEAQHVLGDTPPIIRSLKLHLQPLVLHTWKVVGRVVTGRCQVEYETMQSAHSRTLPDSVQ
jgi:hypothetical protein